MTDSTTTTSAANGPAVLTETAGGRARPVISDLIMVASGFILVAAFLLDWQGRASAATSLAVSALLTLSLALAQVIHSRSIRGYVDIWHPSIFPSIYVMVSFLAPTWSTFVMNHPVGSLAFNITTSPQTPWLAATASAVFSIAAAMVPKPSKTQSPNPDFQRGYAAALGSLGLLFMFASIATALMKLALGGFALYGQNQTTWQVTDVLSVLLGMIPSVGITLLLTGNTLSGRPLLRPHQSFLFIILLILIAASGSRHPIVSAVLPVVVFYTWRYRKLLVPASLTLSILGFMALYSRYRARALDGGAADRSFTDAILTDLAPTAFSIGVVSNQVPSVTDYMMGSTMLAAIPRMLPSPVAVALFGEPNQTGGPTFRVVAGITDTNFGTGFSLPAEGYMNFGLPGMIVIMLLVGAGFAWLYAKRNPYSAWGLVYPIALATAPFGIRSDVLGAGKSVIYPVLLLFAALVVARSNGNRYDRESASTRSSVSLRTK